MIIRAIELIAPPTLQQHEMIVHKSPSDVPNIGRKIRNHREQRAQLNDCDRRRRLFGSQPEIHHAPGQNQMRRRADRNEFS